MRRFGQFARAILAILALVFCGTGRAEAETITFAGSSSGCFNCTSGGSSSASIGGLSFDGSSFAGITVDASGTAQVDLALLTLESSAYNYSRNHTSLLLSVTFTNPADLSGSYAATIEGSINLLGNGAVNVQLDKNYQTYTFSSSAGYGSFDFGMLNPSLHLQAGDTLMLYGVIQNVQYTATTPPGTGDTGGSGGTGGPADIGGTGGSGDTGGPVDTGGTGASGQDPSQPVPEPMTLVLVGGGVAAALRRRARR
jgi:hypothetical protein